MVETKPWGFQWHCNHSPSFVIFFAQVGPGASNLHCHFCWDNASSQHLSCVLQERVSWGDRKTIWGEKIFVERRWKGASPESDNKQQSADKTNMQSQIPFIKIAQEPQTGQFLKICRKTRGHKTCPFTTEEYSQEKHMNLQDTNKCRTEQTRSNAVTLLVSKEMHRTQSCLY